MPLPPVSFPTFDDDAFGHWLAGFIDGEGSFAILRLKRGGKTCYGLRFTLKLRDDDRAVLDHICKRTGIGVVRASTSRLVGNARPQAAWLVENRADCYALIGLLDRCPLMSKKSRDYVVWRAAYFEWSGGVPGHRWRGPRDWSRMAALRDELDRVRAYQ